MSFSMPRFRTVPAAVALTLAMSTPSTAHAQTALTVTAAPTTLRPAEAFQVPVKGKVSGAGAGWLIRVGVQTPHGMQVIAKAKTRKTGRYTAWTKPTPGKHIYRVLAISPKGTANTVSRAFTMTTTTKTKDVVKVTHRTCKIIAKDLWDLGFTTHLTTGERRKDLLRTTAFPYIGVLTVIDGGSYNVDTSFSKTCYPE